MGILSTQNQFLFIHIPKTGGTSLKNIIQPYGTHFSNLDGLEEYLVKSFPDYYFDKGGFAHAPAIHIRNFLDEVTWNGLFKFAIIRNPWERIVSAYTYIQQTPSNRRNAVIKHMSFTDFTRLLCEKLPYGVSHLFTDGNGDIILDKIYRLEDINTQSHEIQQRCGLTEITAVPHLNQSDNKAYRTYYSDIDEERVRKACQVEISIGNYVF